MVKRDRALTLRPDDGDTVLSCAPVSDGGEGDAVFGEVPIRLLFDMTQVVRPGRPGAFRWEITNLSKSHITDLKLHLDSDLPDSFSSRDVESHHRFIKPAESTSYTQTVTLASERGAGFGLSIRLSGTLDGKRRFELVSADQHILSFTGLGEAPLITMRGGADGVYVPGSLAGYRVHIESEGIVNMQASGTTEDITINGGQGVIAHLDQGALSAGNLKVPKDAGSAHWYEVKMTHCDGQGIYPPDFTAFAAGWRNRGDLLKIDFVNQAGKALSAAALRSEMILNVRNEQYGHIVLFVCDPRGKFFQLAPNKLVGHVQYPAADYCLPGALMPLTAEQCTYFDLVGVEHVLGFLVPEPLPAAISAVPPYSPVGTDQMGEILAAMCGCTGASLALVAINVTPRK